MTLAVTTPVFSAIHEISVAHSNTGLFGLDFRSVNVRLSSQIGGVLFFFFVLELVFGFLMFWFRFCSGFFFYFLKIM